MNDPRTQPPHLARAIASISAGVSNGTGFSTGAAETASRSLQVGLLVVAVCAVVVVATTGQGVFLPAAAASGGLRAIRFAGAGVSLAALVALLRRGRISGADRDRGGDPTGAALGSAATIMAVLALVAVLAPGIGAPVGPDPVGGGEGDGAAAGGTGTVGVGLLPPASGTGGAVGGAGGPGSRSGGGDGMNRPDRRSDGGGGAGPAASLLHRLGTLLVLLLLLGAALVGFGALTRRPAPDWEDMPPPPPAVAASDAEAGLAASLGEVDYEGPDPRRQITAAYRRLLAALAAAGAPREPHEAPYEYLGRALGPLGVRSEPIHGLTELYVIAEFSDHPITEEHRSAAAEALEAALDGLRGAQRAREAASVATAEEAEA